MNELFQAYGPLLWLGLSAVVLLLVIWVIVLQQRLERAVSRYLALTAGVEPGNLQTVLEQQVADFKGSAGQIGALTDQCSRLADDVAHAVQGVGVVRFNPFQDTGGDQSFAIALIDGQGNGLVLTSLYGRTERRMYVKPVQAGSSTYQLSDEETEAIRRAGRLPE